MEEQGYVFTKEGITAIGLFNDERVRFSAILDDGSGFAAFDGDGTDLAQFGTVHTVQNFVHPFFVPKRYKATGREVYSMVPELFVPMLREMKSVTGVAQITPAMLLVESDGPIGIGVDWQAGVVEFKDKRVVMATA